MATNYYTETVTAVRHWTDTAFSFTTTRNTGFRFLAGQYTQVGFPNGEQPLVANYFMCSAAHEEHLEFYSTKGLDDELTAKLHALKEGDTVLVAGKPAGALTQNNLVPGAKQLYLLATDAGISPFLSVIWDIDTYEFFDYIVLVQCTSKIKELAFAEYSVTNLIKDEYFGEPALKKLIHYSTVTGERYLNTGSITQLLESGKLEMDMGLTPLDIENDRVMLCGEAPMLAELQALLEARGFTEGNHSKQGHFLVERGLAHK